MKNGSIDEQLRMKERMDEFTNSLQHDDMNSVSQSINQTESQLVIQKRKEEEKKRKGIKR